MNLLDWSVSNKNYSFINEHKLTYKMNLLILARNCSCDTQTIVILFSIPQGGNIKCCSNYSEFSYFAHN